MTLPVDELVALEARLRQGIRYLSRTALEGSKEEADFMRQGDSLLANEGDVYALIMTAERAADAIALLREERDQARELNAGYEEAAADKRRLARAIDVAMHGEEGAAKQASLCDLVHPAELLRARAEASEATANTLRDRVGELETTNAKLVTPRYITEWHEDIGAVLWWHYPVQEPPYVGSPLDTDFDENWHTWWTPLPSAAEVMRYFEARASKVQEATTNA